MPKKTSLGMGSEPTSASCVVRKTRSLGALACAMFHDMLCNMVFVNCIYNMVVDTQFHKFHGRPFARVIRAKRVSNCYIPNSKFVCSTNLGFSGGSNRYMIRGTYIPRERSTGATGRNSGSSTNPSLVLTPSTRARTPGGRQQTRRRGWRGTYT